MTACMMLIASLLPCGVAAQWKIGVEAGYDYNDYVINTQYAYDFHYEGRGGFTIGIPVEYGIFDWLGVRTDLTYVQKGYKMHRAYNETFQNRRDHYLVLPVMARFSFGGERLRGFLHAGGYIGCWLKSGLEGMEKTNATDFEEAMQGGIGSIFSCYDHSYSFNSTRDNRFDAGLAGGVGIAYRVMPRLEVEAEARCYYGLTSTTKDYMKHSRQPRYNTTIAIMAGVKYCF